MKQLLFIYNADSGLFNSLNDFAHKIISPQTYQCSLCALTYGNLSMKSEWKNFLQKLSVQPAFLYKDEFAKKYKLNIALPAIFILNENNIHELINAAKINSCKSLDDLKTLVIKSLADYADEHR